MKVLTLLIGILLIASPVFAQEKEPINVPTLQLPDMQAGVLYSAKKSDFEACATITALKYPTKVGDIELRGGYAIESEPIGAVCFKLGDLSQFGFEQPLHKIINVSAGPFVGYDFDSEEWDFGVLATVIQLTF